MDNRAILWGRHYSKADLENLTDGELVDLIYDIFRNYKGPDYAKLDLMNLVLELARTTNQGEN